MESEPAMCTDVNYKVVAVARLDVLILGNIEKRVELPEELKKSILIRETGRMSKNGDKTRLVGKDA